MARPSGYNLELCKQILNKVAEGKNIKAVLASNKKYPSFETFRVWRRDNPELSALYTRAIEDKADSVDYQIDQVIDEVRNGLIDNSDARLIIDTLKWKAAKYYPKMYGTQNNVDLKSDGQPVGFNVQVHIKQPDE